MAVGNCKEREEHDGREASQQARIVQVDEKKNDDHHAQLGDLTHAAVITRDRMRMQRQQSHSRQIKLSFACLAR